MQLSHQLASITEALSVSLIAEEFRGFIAERINEAPKLDVVALEELANAFARVSHSRCP